MAKKNKAVIDIVPGLILVTCLAIICKWLNSFYKPLSPVAIAIILGILLRNTIRIKGVWTLSGPGLSFAVKRILRFAIILLGVRLSFVEVVKTGGSALWIIIICITCALFLTYFLARMLKLPKRLGTLIGVGTCICGNSAIIATAPTIDAKEEEVSFAVATISLFGVLAVVVYPVIGNLLSMTDNSFGTWAGTAINDTSQVVAAGYLFSEEAGNVATIVKLTRNLFMAPVIVLMSFLYHQNQNKENANKKLDIKKALPLFVFGFIGMAILRTFGVFSPEMIQLIKSSASFLIIVAIAGVGMTTSFASMKKLGLKPFYVGLAASIMMGFLSYFLICCFNIGR